MRLRALELLLAHSFLPPLGPVTRALLGDLGGDRARDFFIPIELHREICAALRHRAQIGGIAEHLRQRDARLDDLGVADGLHVLDAPPTAVEVAHDVAEVVLRRRHLDRHHRLEKLWLCPLYFLLEGHRARDLERPLARVDLVVRAVDQLDLHVDDGIAGEDAAAHCLLDALVDRLDVLLRDLPADDLVDELVALARLLREQVDDSVAVLARAAGLADEPALDLLGRLRDRLAVGDLRPPHVRVDVELALEAVDDDLEVQLAHPWDERLPRLLVRRDAEGRGLLRRAARAGCGVWPGRPWTSARRRPKSPGPGRSSTRARSARSRRRA